MFNWCFHLWLLSVITLVTARYGPDYPASPRCDNKHPPRISYCGTKRPGRSGIQAPGIGIALEVDYGAAVIRQHNGSFENAAFVAGGHEYTNTMHALTADRSLDDDKRRVLAGMISDLRNQVGASYDMLAVAVSTPAHTQLDFDDVTSVLETLSIRNVMHEYVKSRAEDSYLIDATSAYAGYGKGLCESIHSAIECEAQESCLPLHNLLHLHLSNTSFSGSILQHIRAYYNPTVHSTFVNSLGIESLAVDSTDSYWTAVGAAVAGFINSFDESITIVILTGNSGSDPAFLSVLKEILGADIPIESDSDQSMWMAARGAAEIAKRRQEAPFLCIPRCVVPITLEDFDEKIRSRQWMNVNISEWFLESP